MKFEWKRWVALPLLLGICGVMWALDEWVFSRFLIDWQSWLLTVTIAVGLLFGVVEALRKWVPEALEEEPETPKIRGWKDLSFSIGMGVAAICLGVWLPIQGNELYGWPHWRTLTSLGLGIIAVVIFSARIVTTVREQLQLRREARVLPGRAA